MGTAAAFDIRLLMMDVDGVLTDGGIIVHDDGSESKRFHVQDGQWIRIWQRQGLQTAILTGRDCVAVGRRCRELDIEHVIQGAHRKLEVFDELLKAANVSAEQVAYIGDDVGDLPILRRVGFSAAPSNAVPEVKAVVDYVTTRSGGTGAVQELIAYLLRRLGRYEQGLERYQV